MSDRTAQSTWPGGAGSAKLQTWPAAQRAPHALIIVNLLLGPKRWARWTACERSGRAARDNPRREECCCRTPRRGSPLVDRRSGQNAVRGGGAGGGGGFVFLQLLAGAHPSALAVPVAVIGTFAGMQTLAFRSHADAVAWCWHRNWSMTPTWWWSTRAIMHDSHCPGEGDDRRGPVTGPVIRRAGALGGVRAVAFWGVHRHM